MANKVAVDQKEIDRLIRLQRYDQAYEHIQHVRDVIELVVENRTKSLINNEVISEKEKNDFSKLIERNIINKLLEDEGYSLIDESYVKEKEEILKYLKEKRKIK